MRTASPFPADFLWGAATSAYQIEGSPLDDGAGASNWHRFAHTPGLVANGDTGDIACDHYRRYREDVGMMADMGLNAYRFSISWSRILPSGTGSVNQRGLDFYRRLVEALREHGIAPCGTLFHWDLPAALEDRGGWLNRDCAEWFGDYAAIVFAALGDQVPLWATINEPQVIVDGGYAHGNLAPGHRSLFEPAVAAHNLLRAHAAGVRAFRASGSTGRIGLVVNIEPKHPASRHARDLAAAAHSDAYVNRQFLDPVLKGSYPLELREVYGEAWPAHSPEEVRALREPVDFLGVNYYSRSVVTHDDRGWPPRAARVRQRGRAHTAMGWEVYPEGLREVLTWVKSTYGDIPLYVTESGAAFADSLRSDGSVRDPRRVAYLRAHLRAARDAIAEGVNLRGYFAWSLLDNFEWSMGFAKRFGIVYVDFATQRRTPKSSAQFYSDVIRSGGAALDG